MKRIASTIALLGLSACLLAGGAVPAFAAAAPEVSVTAHQSSSCTHDSNAAFTAQFVQEDGTVVSHSFCAACGKVDGEALLNSVTANANFSGLKVFTGTLPDGTRVMTVTCLGGNGARTGVHPNVSLDRDVLAGYDVYAAGADGTMTPVEVQRGRWLDRITVPMDDGAALLVLVPQTEV